MDWHEALGIIAPWVGPGGLAAIIIAYFGYRSHRSEETRAMREGRSGMAFAAMYADHDVLDRLASGLDQLNEGVRRLCGSVDRSSSDQREALERVTRALREAEMIGQEVLSAIAPKA